MKKFGGPAFVLDRSDINTDEIIPARYLTENSKEALAPHLLEDLNLDGFDPRDEKLRQARAIVTRGNFGCGSSREHAVWVFEKNNIDLVVAESFARIFRQNMFNCGMLAVELPKEDIDAIVALGPDLTLAVDLEKNVLMAQGSHKASFAFALNPFDRELVRAGGWLAFADAHY
ncbi:MAG: 3-isopropylmalate dehydratase [Desulfobacterales bacterium CG2_30_60_27]|nr:MAG: 3-isopropylmalate dehydratase [Desulfobacterales bacterium CG2_30_60_27]